MVMAGGAFGGIAGLLMVWIGGGIIVIDVAPGTGIRRVGIITVVACRTIIGDAGMGSLDDIIVIVYIKGSGRPTGFCSMTGSAVIRDTQRGMVRIGGLIEVGGMAIHTEGRGSGIPVYVTTGTLDGGMSAGKREVG